MVYTECFQTVTLVLGGLIVCSVGLYNVGGMSNLHSFVCSTSSPTYNASCGCCGDEAPLTRDMLSIVRPASDPDFPWTGMFFGIWCGSIWCECCLFLSFQRFFPRSSSLSPSKQDTLSIPPRCLPHRTHVTVCGGWDGGRSCRCHDCADWCCDQEIVQRTLCAKTERDARVGSLGAALLKMTPFFFMVVPGVVCRVLYPELIEKVCFPIALFGNIYRSKFCPFPCFNY